MENKSRYRGETFTPMVGVPLDAYKSREPRKAYVDESGGYTIRGFFECISAQIKLSCGVCYFRSSKGKVYFPCYEGLYEMQPNKGNTKTYHQLRKQYRRIVNSHNYATRQAQKAHDSERLEVLDVRGARIDKAYSRLRRQMGS